MLTGNYPSIIQTCNGQAIKFELSGPLSVHNQASSVTVIRALSDSACSERYRDQARCCAGDDDRIAFARILRARSAAGDTAT